MRLLIADCEGMGLDLAVRAVDAGHAVRLVRTPRSRVGEGFKGVTLVDDWRESVDWVGRDGLILNTGNCKWLGELDRLRDFGFKVFGPTKKSAALEIDRAKGLEAMQQAGIDVPVYECFDTLQKALAHARKADKGYVFKTMGDEDDKSLSYVADDPADLVGWIQRKIDAGMVLKGPCMLQEKIDMVSEIGVSGWFGPEGFLPERWQVCFEYKKLMAGDYGPNTGEMGTVCQYVANDKIASEMLLPLQNTLLGLGHRGDFAIGCGVDKAGKAWPFEFTVRCGWPAFFIQTASHQGDPVQWMRDLMDGDDTLEVSRQCAVGVVLAQPPWPYEHGKPEQVEGNPISGTSEVWDQVHPAHMMVDKGPVMRDGSVVTERVCQTAGTLVACVTGLGDTVSEAREKAYDVVGEISYADMIVRDDIGLKTMKELPKLHGFGFARQLRA